MTDTPFLNRKNGTDTRHPQVQGQDPWKPDRRACANERDHEGKIRRILARLHEAEVVRDMGFPGFKLYLLKGDKAKTWSVWVSGNWRITYRFGNGNAYDVDLVDYH